MTKDTLERAIEHFKGELAKIRAGRVSTDLFENIEVDAYGSKLPLNQVATLSSPEPRMVVITPWDKTMVKNIEEALRATITDINPVVDGEAIRVVFPAPTEERRMELVKEVRKIVEEGKVRMRQLREDAMHDLKIKEEKKEISEDEFFRERDVAQKLITEYNGRIEEIGKKKEEEITTL